MAKSVLMIDAEQPFAGTIADELSTHGLSVEVVADGKEGLEKAKSADPKPDLIILCVELPKMSGYSICNKLKKDDALKEIPLIITSSEATKETFEQHKKLKTRADGYLIKPFESAALIAEIQPLVALEGDEEVIDLGDEDLDVDSPGEMGSDDFDLTNLASEVGDDALDDLEVNLDDDDDAEDLSIGDLSLDDEPLSLDDVDTDEALGDFDDSFDSLTDEGGAGGEDSALDESSAVDEISLDDADLDDLLEDDSPQDSTGDALEALDGLEEIEPIDALDPDPAQDEESAADETEPVPEPTPEPTATSSASAVNVSSGELAELEKQVRELRRENNEYNSRVVELETRLKTAEEEARKKSADLDNVQSSSSSSQRELLNLKQQLHEKEKELFTLKEQAFSKEKEAFEATEKLSEVERRADEAKAQLADRDATIVSLNTKVESLTEERNTIERELQQKINKLESDVASAQADRDAKVAEIERERDSLKQKLEATEKIATERAEQIDRLSGEVSSKDEQITELYAKNKDDEEMRVRALKAVEIANALLSGEVRADDSGEEIALEM